ncbi:TadE/TadG family type IV pilus assembly protein [Pseudomonas sp. TCU-HL1]|uniref:TadE/TadG family type IV pilus assembly protein n=1 Tax=Pseudomonas sp. TCU-HL1 TaxID=1856685 RepID=UPI00083D4376|nr:TadE/TadG family type IV pilus assembly protein [Pseudomonas sp. TCU-HL1]AOE84481.1 membrane protein [Pseudomonas sp. TCU-HL1]
MNMHRMRGVYVVEFAVIGLLLFILLFAVLEMGRLYFTVNALNETVRRGARLAAVCDIRDPRILRRAIFNAATDSGASSLIGSLDTADLTLTYLDENGATVASPDDLSGATGFRAIRFVQLRLQNFSFDLLIPVLGGSITLQEFRSTFPRESLGRHAEADALPEITPC